MPQFTVVAVGKTYRAKAPAGWLCPKVCRTRKSAERFARRASRYFFPE